ncbi:hypothetical protein GQ44DRAFT_673431 [Phaeosphaeriaceae sp. PMI808]|nr:hypothetical protein GQ44DRAFT_673431 [Phaeosphaeriaceae sp. PMI808]
MGRNRPRGSKPALFYCGMCSKCFSSKPDLNQHTQSHADNAPMKVMCQTCNRQFNDTVALERHKIAVGHSEKHIPTSETSVSCDRCSDTFKTSQEYDAHRSFQLDGPCSDRRRKTPPKNRVGYLDPDNLNEPANMKLNYGSEPGEIRQLTCETESEEPTNLSKGQQWCGRCKTTFDSMARYNAHFLWCTATHGPSNDLPVQERQERVSKPPKRPKRDQGRGRGRGAPPPTFRAPQTSRAASSTHRFEALTPAPTSLNMGGPYEMEQAKDIYGKILRLLICSDIFIHHDGRMTVSGIDWTRIGLEKQQDIVRMFDSMCHLPKMLQGEYLPPSKAFQDEYIYQYPMSDFEPSRPRDNAKPGLGVVALWSSKIVLANGLQDIVKVAAVDVVSCRILMNHLVCTDPKAEVSNWRTKETGLSSWSDMEEARKQGFKVFRGWSKVRSELWRFVDSETIIVGHNLRSDLDALRMMHGRAVDVAKVAEKAAKGPLSKQQVGLDSLCLSFPEMTLKSDPDFGRDALMNAFAARELGLWIIKNREMFDKKMIQKSVDYQRVIGSASKGGN